MKTTKKKTTKKKAYIGGVEVKGDVEAFLSIGPPRDLKKIVGAAQADINAALKRLKIVGAAQADINPALKRLEAAMQKLKEVKQAVGNEDRSDDAFPD